MNSLIEWYIVFAVGLFVTIVLASEIGRRSGFRMRKSDPEGATRGTGTIDAAIFGLMGLLLTFTFFGAASRFDSRREDILREANTIGTAFLRIKLVPPPSQQHIREKFRQYLDARIAVYKKIPDLAAAASELRRADSLKQDIWTMAISACEQTHDPAVKSLVLGSLNEMFDMADLRTGRARMHPPIIIYVMLLVLVIACSLLAGNVMAESKARNWLHILSFAVILTLTVLVIVDLEFPRIGTIRIDEWDRVLQELRASMT